MRYIILFLFFSANAIAATPEVFNFTIEPVLQKLTADPQHKGGVLGQKATGSGPEKVSVTLSKCETYDGAEHCVGTWQKHLAIDDVDYLFFASISNQAKSDIHSAELFICVDHVQKVDECKTWISNQIDFHGTTAPRVELFDSGHSNLMPGDPATYQPVLKLGEEVQ